MRLHKRSDIVRVCPAGLDYAQTKARRAQNLIFSCAGLKLSFINSVLDRAMSKLETIPAEEGAALLPQKPQSTGIRRVVVAAAVASFALGLLAATAVTSPW